MIGENKMLKIGKEYGVIGITLTIGDVVLQQGEVLTVVDFKGHEAVVLRQSTGGTLVLSKMALEFALEPL